MWTGSQQIGVSLKPMLPVNLLRVSSGVLIFLSNVSISSCCIWCCCWIAVWSAFSLRYSVRPTGAKTRKAPQGQQRPVLQQYWHQLKQQRHLSIGKTVCGTSEMGPFTSVLVCLMQFAGIEPEGLELFLRQVFLAAGACRACRLYVFTCR